MKACRDCRHIKRATSRYTSDLCLHPKSAAVVPDYVNGVEVTIQPAAMHARTIGACKPEALLWESGTARAEDLA